MQRAPVDTSQTPPSHVDTVSLSPDILSYDIMHSSGSVDSLVDLYLQAGNIDGNVTTGYGDHASSQSTLKVDSLMTDKPSFYLPLDKAGMSLNRF